MRVSLPVSLIEPVARQKVEEYTKKSELVSAENKAQLYASADKWRAFLGWFGLAWTVTDPSDTDLIWALDYWYSRKAQQAKNIVHLCVHIRHHEPCAHLTLEEDDLKTLGWL